LSINLDFDSVLSGGFAYKIDLLYKMHRLGAKIAEIPIAFGLRDRGISKMERNNFMDSLKSCSDATNV
jgi:dolichol-phosphate mannosyltransferase